MPGPSWRTPAYGQWVQIKRAFLVRAGQWTELLAGTGATQTVATAINDAGEVLGTN